MKSFDKKNKIKQIFTEFEKYDRMHQFFLSDLENSVYNFVAEYPNDIIPKDNFSKAITAFAFSLINNVYGTLEKNATYSTYRFTLELENMDTSLKRYPKPKEHSKASDNFSQLTKAIITKHFPDLYTLSANGFRLLERNLNYTINTFLSYLYRENES